MLFGKNASMHGKREEEGEAAEDRAKSGSHRRDEIGSPLNGSSSPFNELKTWEIRL
jgi:hypothetical protein